MMRTFLLIFSLHAFGQTLENSDDQRAREIFEIRDKARVLQGEKLKSEAADRFIKANSLKVESINWMKVESPGAPFISDKKFTDPIESEVGEIENSHGDKCKLARMLFNHHSSLCVLRRLRMFCYGFERPYAAPHIYANDAERFAKVEGYCTNRRTQAEYKMYGGASSVEYHVEEIADLSVVKDYLTTKKLREF